MQKYMYDAVIFDCDGVLVDTERLTNEVFMSLLAEQGLHLTHMEMHTHFTGQTTEVNLVTAATLLGRALPEDTHHRLRAGFWEAMHTGLTTVPFVEETLQAIRLPKAMATNALREDMDFKLSQTGLHAYFDHCFCVEDVENPKPAPDIYLRAASALGAAPERCVVVEDSTAGITAAVAAGMTVYAYSADMDAEKQKAAGAALCFHDMRELVHLLSRRP
ncbi:predicted phosphatase/phosphohexomutase [Hahella chejuensis KCTC 2396]|uniref:Predicted phosphatase/phosphohexomutase n=1 Tax=Hahella chejuensis (strain KCTC 2396) TaxID=349521 RepID=Q2SNQ1_HAHCH|nr:HAD family phosphatase [Hahella chejuensis]ABC27723.1 predicted phosphatase/phosphohexomutase [Hahella chejuensis KCTC 2396]